jgi:hypothetical protein
MSNWGQAALTIVGTVVGFAVGYPALGFYLGSLAGQALFPTDLGNVNGPRLNDLTVQTATIGAPIPIVYGTFAFSGNVIWSSGIIETVTKTKQGGKGGPTQTVTTYSYAVNVAVGICEGEILGISRIWADSVLLFDGRALASQNPNLASNLAEDTWASLANKMQIYTGSEEQMPDPTIESFEGVGNVSAFRGLAYVVFNDFQLENYGNRIPNFRFEVMRGTNKPPLTLLEDENKGVADGYGDNDTLQFITRTGQSYWIAGILTAQETNAAGAPGIGYAYTLTSTPSGWVSRDALGGSWIQPDGTSPVYWPRIRAMDELSTPYITTAYGGFDWVTAINEFVIDSVLMISPTSDDGTFAINWGLGDMSAVNGRTSLKAGSWMAVRALTPATGWTVRQKDAEQEKFGANVDPAFTVELQGSSTYLIRGTFVFNVPAACGAKVSMYADGTGAAGFIQTQLPAYANGPLGQSHSATEAGVLGTPNMLVGGSYRALDGTGDATTFTDYSTHYEFTALVVTGPKVDPSDSFYYRMQWGQNVSAGTRGVIMKAGSGVVARRLNLSSNTDVEWAVKQQDETRMLSAMADDPELFIYLNGSTAYWVEMVVTCYTRYEYAHKVSFQLAFDGDLEEVNLIGNIAFVYDLGGWENNNAYIPTNRTPAALGTVLEVSSMDTGSIDRDTWRGGLRLRGLIRTGTNGGTLRVRWSVFYGADPSPVGGTVYRGSFITAHQLALMGSEITLGEIVEDVNLRSGLAPEQIDVTDLTELVDGYVISRPMTGRDAITPLQLYGFFDCVESAGVLKWPKRGKPTVATLTEDDLAAHVTGEARPSAMGLDRKLEDELPRRLRVHYPQADKNYEAGEQGASRLTGGSAEMLDIEIPVAMSDTKAAQISESLLYDMWVTRTSYNFFTGNDQLALEPADAILLPIEGRMERVRLTSGNQAVQGLLTYEALRDDDGVFVSYAIGSPNSGSGVVNVPNYPGEVNAVILDLPPLRDEDNDGGYYAAINAIGSTNWGGATLFRSADGGVTYEMVGNTALQATIGTLDAALPSGPSTIQDEGNELLVTLTSGELESIVWDSLLVGYNAAAIGADGRWEVIQFQTAELVTGRQWRLTGLLRGRRGTEWAIGLSQSGDAFVLLDEALIRVSSNVSAIGAARKIKPALASMSIEEVEAIDFTPQGVPLKPFAGVDATGARDISDNLTITWIRRARLGQELPSGSDIALYEAAEAYEVEILDSTSSPQTVLRTIPATTPSVAYSATDQTTDFGSAQSAVTVRIYQLSAIVGRGYPLEATV